MKKKYLFIIISMLAVVMVAYYPVKKTVGKTDFMSNWGKILSKDSKDKTSDLQKRSNTKYGLFINSDSTDNATSSEDIFEVGNDVVITNQEIQIAKEFFALQGQSEKDAAQAAVKYVEEYNAMYVEAVSKGYDVTEKEIDEYISELKAMTMHAENSKDVKKVMAQFDSEDEYWNYQKEVCKKQLPVQKYVKSLEEEYLKNGDITAWNDELNKIKEEAAKKQQYR